MSDSNTTLKLTNKSVNGTLRVTGNPEGVLPKLKERPMVWPGDNLPYISYDPVISSMMDTNEVIPGIPSSPHVIEAQANYNAGMPVALTSDGDSIYNVGGDWSQYTNAEPGKHRLSVGKKLDAIREMGKSGLIHFNKHSPRVDTHWYTATPANTLATMNLGDLFTDMHLVPGHLLRSISVSRLLMDRIGLARTNAARKYIGNVGTLNEGEKAPNWNDYDTFDSFNKAELDYSNKRMATSLNNIYNDSTHPLTRPIMMHNSPLSASTSPYSVLKLEGHFPIPGGATEYPEEYMRYMRTGDLPIKFGLDYYSGYMPALVSANPPYITIGGDTLEYAILSPIDANELEYKDYVPNEYPINVTKNSLGLKAGDRFHEPGTVVHEGIHGMTNHLQNKDSNIYSDLYGNSKDRPGYTLMNSWESLRSHKVLKTAFARDLIRQGLPEEEIVNRVQDPQAFLQWLDTTIYNGGEGGGFSFPEGVVPAGMEREYYRAAMGFRPFIGELLDKAELYNSWDNANTPDRLRNITPLVDPKKYSKLTPLQRLELFLRLHPQVRNTRSNNIYNYLA